MEIFSTTLYISCIYLNFLRPGYAPRVLGLSEGNDIDLVRLQNSCNLLTLLLDSDGFLLLLPNAIKGPAELTHEALDDFGRDVFLLENSILAGLLKGIQDNLGGVGLGEHTGSNLFSATLGGSRVRSTIRPKEELGVAGRRGPEKRITIGRGLGDRLAEAERITGPRVDDDGKVVGGDRTGDGGPALLDGLNGGGGGTVFQDDAEVGEPGVEIKQRGEESLLRRQHCHIALRRDLSMEVQHQPLALHLGKNGVELRIVDHARARVGGDTGGIALDSCDAALLGFDDGLWGDRLVQVQRHEVVDIGLNGLQPLLVVQGAVDGGNGRDQIGLGKRELDRRSDWPCNLSLTMTKTVFTPPCRMVGVTSSIIGPSRRWTVAGQSWRGQAFVALALHTVEVSRGGELGPLQLGQGHFADCVEQQIVWREAKCPAGFSVLPGGGSRVPPLDLYNGNSYILQQELAIPSTFYHFRSS